MRITDQQLVYTNQFPFYASEVYSGTGLTTTIEGDDEVLLCTFRIGSAKMSPDGRIALFASADGGLSWQRRDSPMDADGTAGLIPAWGSYQLAGPHIGSSPGGDLVLAAGRMEMARPGTADWNSQAAGIVDADFVVSRWSAGEWSPLAILDGRRHSREWSIPCGSPVEVVPGTWFLPGERHAMPDDDTWLRRYHAFAYLSDDDGLTWYERGPMMNDPDERFVYYDQHVTLSHEGQLLSIAWVHDAVDDQTVTARSGWSDDLGRTWSQPRDTGIVGGPVAPLTLPDGRMFAVYPRRAAPTGVRACVSEDGGHTWETDHEFVIWDETRREIAGRAADDVADLERAEPLWDTMWSWTFGLPSPALMADGTVGVAFYASDRNARAGVHFVRVEV